MQDHMSVFSGRLLPQSAPKLRRQDHQSRSATMVLPERGRSWLARLPFTRAGPGSRIVDRPQAASSTNHCSRKSTSQRQIPLGAFGWQSFPLGVKQHREQLVLAGNSLSVIAAHRLRDLPHMPASNPNLNHRHAGRLCIAAHGQARRRPHSPASPCGIACRRPCAAHSAYRNRCCRHCGLCVAV